VRRTVYMLGPRSLDRLDEVMADVLTCGPQAVASHLTAAGVFGIRPLPLVVEVSVPAAVRVRPPGVRVHRRRKLRPEDVGRYHGIPVTSPIQTLIDLGTRLGRESLEAGINEADKLDLVDPETLRAALAEHVGEPGVAMVRKTLDRRTFTMTDTELERRFLPIARRAGLAKPQTQVWVNGFKVDFCWPDLGLVVETDGLRYHRTPAEQAADRMRDQTHAAAGLTPLRFTRAQVRYEPAHVEDVLTRVARRLRG
jgi:very-short-patch-repair endonuclease